MAGRAHLSIGEVLSLLQEEFPDVTISKIRFLESQGLVDPERTPSGYRKFYEGDIDRLRWVLRQQRDAFLPLKVIKGRLEEQGELPYDDPEAGDRLDVTVVQVVEEHLVVEAGRPARGGEAGAPSEARPSAHVNGRAGAGSAPPPRPAPARPPAPAATEPLFDAGPPYVAAGAPSPEGGADPARHRPPAPGASAPPPPVRPAAAAGAEDSAAPAGGRGPVSGRGPAAGRDLAAGRGTAAGPAFAGPRAGRTSRAGEPVPVPADDELSLEELVAEPGVDLETVRDLERYGLITSRLVGSVAYYSHDAAAIARLASAFAHHGVEARHLRAYKGAAEREAGMVQQVIMPLIRQRNPEAREAAARAVEELSQLGGELRAALLRSALADLH